MQMAAEAGVPARLIGRTGGDRVRILVAGAPAIDCAVVEAENVWSRALGRYFTRTAA
jgi:hypothetical protein